MTTDRPVVIVRTYSGPTPQAAGEQYAADAARLAAEGYRPGSQQWQGTTLTVTYQRDVAPPPPAPTATIHYQQKGTGVGGGVGQGIGFGLGCLILVVIVVIGIPLLLIALGSN